MTRSSLKFGWMDKLSILSLCRGYIEWKLNIPITNSINTMLKLKYSKLQLVALRGLTDKRMKIG